MCPLPTRLDQPGYAVVQQGSTREKKNDEDDKYPYCNEMIGPPPVKVL